MCEKREPWNLPTVHECRFYGDMTETCHNEKSKYFNQTCPVKGRPDEKTGDNLP